ncbi:MAG TPA: alpha/beta-hydrolase family protein, partial [Dermatophilaceae bacterium]
TAVGCLARAGGAASIDRPQIYLPPARTGNMAAMTDNGRFRIGELDISARAGLLLGAYATGMSYQPNLLSRGTRDQAIITGVAAASAYGWGSTAHSFLRSTADRLPTAKDSLNGRIATGALVDGAAFLAGLALSRARPPQEHEPGRRALARLSATTTMAAAACGLVADALESGRGQRGGRTAAIGTAFLGAATGYAVTRPRRSSTGAHDRGTSEDLDTGGEHNTGEDRENVHREVSPPKAIASGMVVTLALVAVARSESALSGRAARVAAALLGGSPQDHRSLGRLASFGVLGAAGWGAVGLVNKILTKPGSSVEGVYRDPPSLPEVTGSPESAIPWTDQSRESARWLSMTLTAQSITEVIGEPARQPIRVYSPLDAAANAEDRAALLLAEIDRTRALERSAFAIFSPTGSGYINYVACETFEYLTRGDCASAGIQYSVLPSALSLTKVDGATHQTRMVINGIIERLMAIPPEKRPRFYLFGESLGSQVSEEMFVGTGLTGPPGIGLDAAVWIGTPASTRWWRELWGTRTVAKAPEVGPGSAYLPRAVRDWHALAPQEKARVRFLFLQNGDDPIPKFGPSVLWRRPDWLGPHDQRPPGAPRGTRWMPVTTYFMTFLDMQNALVPIPGIFDEGGHDYRREIPGAIRTVWGLDVNDEQMERVQQALRTRELLWAVRRSWHDVEVKPTPQRPAAEQQLVDKVSAWTGRTVDLKGVRSLAEGQATA